MSSDHEVGSGPASIGQDDLAAPGRWSVEQINDWYAAQPWLVGCNYLPRTAINQIEMWQAESFDEPTLDEELGWAESIGLNSLRVYLHDIVWSIDPEGFLATIDRFLGICARHGIRPMLVFFDDCHHADPRLGQQPDPLPGVHNSGWRQSPGLDIVEAFADGTLAYAERVRLQGYVQGVIRHFRDDDRVLLWDLYNEPGNKLKAKSAPLLRAVWQWAREVAPSQPMTTAANAHNHTFVNPIHAANSDILSFHCYNHDGPLANWIAALRASSPDRPILCTEYMARTKGSTFGAYLPVFKQENIGCYHWGFVAGKSGTIWPWESEEQAREPEPELWFHDLLRPDGSPYRQDEVDLIRELTRRPLRR